MSKTRRRMFAMSIADRAGHSSSGSGANPARDWCDIDNRRSVSAVTAIAVPICFF
jgi:hypothetical protein